MAVKSNTIPLVGSPRSFPNTLASVFCGYGCGCVFVRKWIRSKKKSLREQTFKGGSYGLESS